MSGLGIGGQHSTTVLLHFHPPKQPTPGLLLRARRFCSGRADGRGPSWAAALLCGQMPAYPRLLGMHLCHPRVLSPTPAPRTAPVPRGNLSAAQIQNQEQPEFVLRGPGPGSRDGIKTRWGQKSHPHGDVAGQQSPDTLGGSGTFLARGTRAFLGTQLSLRAPRVPRHSLGTLPQCLQSCGSHSPLSLQSSQAAKTALGGGGAGQPSGKYRHGGEYGRHRGRRERAQLKCPPLSTGLAGQLFFLFLEKGSKARVTARQGAGRRWFPSANSSVRSLDQLRL